MSSNGRKLSKEEASRANQCIPYDGDPLPVPPLRLPVYNLPSPVEAQARKEITELQEEVVNLQNHLRELKERQALRRACIQYDKLVKRFDLQLLQGTHAALQTDGEELLRNDRYDDEEREARQGKDYNGCHGNDYDN